jgi:hypothetical protein
LGFWECIGKETLLRPGLGSSWGQLAPERVSERGDHSIAECKVWLPGKTW